MSTVSESLSQLEVLVVDCQATAAAPHGHLLEVGWATDCCGSEHASGEKVGETAMLMKTTPMKPGVD
jgi:hypothetical protein